VTAGADPVGSTEEDLHQGPRAVAPVPAGGKMARDLVRLEVPLAGGDAEIGGRGDPDTAVTSVGA